MVGVPPCTKCSGGSVDIDERDLLRLVEQARQPRGQAHRHGVERLNMPWGYRPRAVR